ncbi:MAG: ABC transporter ATP-binding protein [Flavobacteriales bacterium]|nr:ABC transporter ATP-binding protein [Flavobacteriales bacterium]
MNDFIFRAEHIVKRYANHTALHDVSLSIPRGKVFGLLGPNGAGKTTMIRIINQIIAPDEGALYFNNEPLGLHHIGRIGYLPEERGLYKKMKVGEHAMYLAQLKGLSKKEAQKKLDYWFDKFELHGWWNKRIEELSKGMQQKVQFIVTVLHEPELLIFDEPFSGFDPVNAELIKKEILELKSQGATIIFSTHRMESVEELCDHIALINKSRKILDGSVKEIRQQYKTNQYRLGFNGSTELLKQALPPGVSVLHEHTDEEEHFLTLHIPPPLTSNEILKICVNHVDVHHFNEQIPSMNEIFIQQVKGISHE